MKLRNIKFKLIVYITAILSIGVFTVSINVHSVLANIPGSVSGSIYMMINGSKVPLKDVRLEKQGVDHGDGSPTNGQYVDLISWYGTDSNGYYAIENSGDFYKGPGRQGWEGTPNVLGGKHPWGEVWSPTMWCGDAWSGYGGWCGVNCAQNPNRIRAYFPKDYSFPYGNDMSKGHWYLPKTGATFPVGDWHYFIDAANDTNFDGYDFEWRPDTPTPTPTPIPPTPTPTPIPPTPTSVPPTPTPTPVPPTPTPVQPTAVVALSLPQAQTFSDDRKSRLGQSWICIQSTPCSQAGVSCSGGNKEHRVRIQTKEGTTLKMNSTPTYVFECVSPDQQSYRCTTGNDSLDQTLISKSNLTGLARDYGYSFVSYTNTQNVRINQSNINSVPRTTATGTFGPYEWESKTDVQVWRLIMTMQDLDWNPDAQQGSVGALQQATFSFSNGDYNRDCVIIKWDPQGIIYDIASLHPIEGAKVTLYVKNAAGIFVPMQDQKWGLLANPILSSQQGNYQFFVPAGTYKIEVEKQGYELVTDKNVVSLVKNIKNIYNGGEIVTKGEIQEVNILMRKESMFNSIIDSIKSLFIHEK